MFSSLRLDVPGAEPMMLPAAYIAESAVAGQKHEAERRVHGGNAFASLGLALGGNASAPWSQAAPATAGDQMVVPTGAIQQAEAFHQMSVPLPATSCIHHRFAPVGYHSPEPSPAASGSLAEGALTTIPEDNTLVLGEMLSATRISCCHWDANNRHNHR